MRFSVRVCCSIFYRSFGGVDTPEDGAYLYVLVLLCRLWWGLGEWGGVGRGLITPLALTPVLDAMLLDSSCIWCYVVTFSHLMLRNCEHQTLANDAKLLTCSCTWCYDISLISFFDLSDTGKAGVCSNDQNTKGKRCHYSWGTGPRFLDRWWQTLDGVLSFTHTRFSHTRLFHTHLCHTQLFHTTCLPRMNSNKPATHTNIMINYDKLYMNQRPRDSG